MRDDRPEYCCDCKERTGRTAHSKASKHHGENGPYCDDCYESNKPIDTQALLTEALDAMDISGQLDLPDFLEWIAARLVHTHGDHPHVDFVCSLRDRAKKCRAVLKKAGRVE
jgi:hypothetical protein